MPPASAGHGAACNVQPHAGPVSAINAQAGVLPWDHRGCAILPNRCHRSALLIPSKTARQRTLNPHRACKQSCSDKLAGVLPHEPVGRLPPSSAPGPVMAGPTTLNNIGPERIYQQICGGISCRRGPRCRSGQHPPDLFGSNMPVPPHRLGSVIVRAIHRGRKSDRRQPAVLALPDAAYVLTQAANYDPCVVARPLAELHCHWQLFLF